MDQDKDQGKTLDERIAKATAKEETQKQETVEEKQPEPMPSSDQKPTDEVSDELSLPEEVSSRTKEQFEKLKRKLADAEARAKTSDAYGTSVFDTTSVSSQPKQQPDFANVNPQNIGFLSQDQIGNVAQNFVDADGNVNVDGLNRALKEANDRAYLAQIETQKLREEQARFEESRQLRETYKEFPEMDPLKKEKFDPMLYKLVKAELIDMRQRGLKPELVDVVREVKSQYRPVDEAKVREKVLAETKAVQNKRDQGPIETGTGQPRFTTDDLSSLRERTRRGDDSALSERLKALGI